MILVLFFSKSALTAISCDVAALSVKNIYRQHTMVGTAAAASCERGIGQRLDLLQ